MGMHHYANDGYFIEVYEHFASIFPLLSPAARREFEDFVKIDEGDAILDEADLADRFAAYLADRLNDGDRSIQLLINDHIVEPEIFRFDDEYDEGDDVDEDGLFLVFDQTDLFTVQKNTMHKKLDDLGIGVEYKRWVNWG